MERSYLLITEKFLFWTFRRWKIRGFLSQKVDGKMSFSDYWKVHVLNFSEMGNTVSFWAKMLMERWYLLITGKFLFWTFRWWEIRYFFEPKSWWKDHIYQLLKSSCFELFRDEKYGLFWAKKLMEKLNVLGLSELSIILQDLGNMAFHAVKRGSLMGAKASKRFLIHYFNSFAASSEI